MKILLTILLFACSAFPCGAPSDVFGRIAGRGVVVMYPVDSPLLISWRYPHFGFYRFPAVTPCVVYRATVWGKEEYPTIEFLVHSEPVEVNFEPLK